MSTLVENQTDITKPKSRIEFIDSLRGFTMILVVYHHIILWVTPVNSDINNLFLLFRMPLFFFISGFMLYSQKSYKQWIHKRVKNRFLNQFLPTFFTGFLYCTFASVDYVTALYSSSKSGYWFTIVLFEIFILYLLVTIILDELHLNKYIRLLVYTLVILFSFLINKYLVYTALSSQSWYNLFCVGSILHYLPYFLFGVVCRMFITGFRKLTENQYVNISLIIVFTICFLCNKANTIIFGLLGITGILIIYSIFQSNKEFFSNKTTIGKGLSYIGKNTLPIYFLHYFLLKGITFKGDFISFLDSNWLAELIVCFTLSVLVVGLTLLLNKLIDSVKLLHALMFGPHLK